MHKSVHVCKDGQNNSNNVGSYRLHTIYGGKDLCAAQTGFDIRV